MLVLTLRNAMPWLSSCSCSVKSSDMFYFTIFRIVGISSYVQMNLSINVIREFNLQGRPIRFYMQNTISLVTHFHVSLNRYRFRPI